MLTFISVASRIRMVALTGQLLRFEVDAVSAVAASRVTHSVVEKGALFHRTASDTDVTAAAAVQTFLTDGLSAGEMFH